MKTGQDMVLFQQIISKQILKDMRILSYKFSQIVFQEAGTASCAAYFILKKKTSKKGVLISILIEVQTEGQGD